MTTLAELRVGATASVREVQGFDDVALRLMEMGLTPGALVAVVGEAPLGDPLELEVRGYRLSVRRSEAQRIEVDPVHESAS
jgi:ferrous iron transport protein A